MVLELRHCRYFLAVYEAGSVTKAAHELRIAQPSLSQQIKKLETMLGTELFIRSNKQFVLTPAGDAFLPHARGLVKAAENAVLEVAGVLEFGSASLRIAFIPSMASFVAVAAAKFAEAFPEVRISLMQEEAREIDRRLLANEIDIGIAAKRVSPPEINCVDICEEPYVLAYREGHALADKKLSRLDGIGDTPFAMFCYGSFARDTMDSYLSRIHFSPRAAMEVNCLECLLDIVATTNVCAMLPRAAASRHPNIAMAELKNPTASRVLTILTRDVTLETPTETAFTKLLREEVLSAMSGNEDTG